MQPRDFGGRRRETDCDNVGAGRQVGGAKAKEENAQLQAEIETLRSKLDALSSEKTNIANQLRSTRAGSGDEKGVLRASASKFGGGGEAVRGTGMACRLHSEHSSGREGEAGAAF